MDIPTIYCEQFGGIGFQHLNIISNIFFILSVVVCLKKRKSQGDLQTRDYFLTGLFLLVGVGSLLWHLMPNNATDYADTLPIILFALIALILITRKIFIKNIPLQIVSVFSILLIGLFLEQLPFFNGSMPYVFLLLIFVAITHFFKNKNRDASRNFRTASLLFFVGILARTFDLFLCNYIPIGTHFLWHILVASMGYFLLLGISALYRKI